MQHEIDKKNIEISEGNYTFKDVLSKEYAPSSLREEMENCNLLFIPYENFRDRKGLFFPEDTYRLYDYFKENEKSNGIRSEICISDEEYLELELHADTVNIASIIVNSAAFSIVCSMIASYLYDKFKTHNKKDVNMNITVTVEENEKSKTIHYRGNIEDFEKSMESIDKHLFK